VEKRTAGSEDRFSTPGSDIAARIQAEVPALFVPRIEEVRSSGGYNGSGSAPEFDFPTGDMAGPVGSNATIQ
jgi:hypothetical protein